MDQERTRNSEPSTKDLSRRDRVPHKMKSAVSIAALLAAICWSRAASPHETVTTTVLFDREIVGILNRHCVMCHVEKGPSFPLETYEQAWLQRRQMSAAVL